MPRRNYSAKDIVKHVREKYGRCLSEETLIREMRSKFKKNAIYAKEAAEIIHSRKLASATIDPEIKERIKRELTANQKRPPVERKPHDEIGREVLPSAGKRYPISRSQIKKINKQLKESKGITKRVNTNGYDGKKKDIFYKAKEIIRKNPTIVYKDLLKKVNLTQHQLETLFRQYNVSFNSLRKNAKKKLIDSKDKSFRTLHKRRPTSKELSELTGFPERYVESERKRDGKGSGARAHIEIISPKILRMINFFSISKTSISTRDLARLFDTNHPRIHAAASNLEKKGFIKRTGRIGNEISYKIKSKGAEKIHFEKTQKRSREEVAQGMSVNELETTLNQLNEMKKEGLKIPNKIFNLLKTELNRIRIEKLKKQSNKFDRNGIDISKK